MCLAGRDFYKYVLACLAESPNVTLRLGEEVRGCTEENGRVCVETSGGTLSARQVFDGRGLLPGSPTFEEARRRPSSLLALYLVLVLVLTLSPVVVVSFMNVGQGIWRRRVPEA